MVSHEVEGKRVVELPPSSGTRSRIPPFQWKSPRTWLPVVALAMLVTGAWMLIPRGMEDETRLPAPDRSLPTVVVDAGHGGEDSGASRNGLREKDLTLDVARRIERRLRSQGFPVVMTRRDDRLVSLLERSQVANRIPRALFISIHFNDSSTGAGEGVETFYAEQKDAFSDDGWSFAKIFRRRREAPPLDQGASFARSVQMSMVSNLSVADRGAKPRQLSVVRRTRCPAVLVEGGFLNNPADARKIAREDYRDRLAEAIADGTVLYYRHLQAEQLSATLQKK